MGEGPIPGNIAHELCGMKTAKLSESFLGAKDYIRDRIVMLAQVGR